MKKTASILLLLAMVFSLAACASKPKDNGFSADLSDFYANNFSGDDVPAMEQLQDDETIESLYPGLTAIERKQTVLATALISAVAAEVAMVEVANADDVEKVKVIFQARIDYMVGDGNGPGGAWYPETMEQWETNSEIVVRDNYVCLFVGENKDALVSAFNALG